MEVDDAGDTEVIISMEAIEGSPEGRETLDPNELCPLVNSKVVMIIVTLKCIRWVENEAKETGCLSLT